MEGYLGEFPVTNLSETEFADYTIADWALYFVGMYGQFDGEHHKAWTLDQVARILNGAPIIVMEARWNNGTTEYRVSVGDNERYQQWVSDMRGELTINEFDEEEYEYEYNNGCAP